MLIWQKDVGSLPITFPRLQHPDIEHYRSTWGTLEYAKGTQSLRPDITGDRIWQVIVPFPCTREVEVARA
jgi:hypothetical protein